MNYTIVVFSTKPDSSDDVELYRSRITLSSLQDIFFGGHKQLTYQFRRCLDNDYISTTMEFLAGNKCDAQNPWIVVIIREKQSETTLSENLSDFCALFWYNWNCILTVRGKKCYFNLEILKII